MVKRLRKDKHIAIPVHNGQQATDLIESDFDFDCIMMDLQYENIVQSPYYAY